MAHTDEYRSRLALEALPITPWSRAILVCMAILPYGMYFSLAGLLGLLCWTVSRQPHEIFKLLHRHGFIWLSGLLMVSSSLAVYRGEAWLQLANFLPFFLLWAVFVVHCTAEPHPWQFLRRCAWVLVLGTLPLNLFAIVEFWLKTNGMGELLTTLPIIHVMYTGAHRVMRSCSVFDYFNTYANYLVMMIGLSLGLIQWQIVAAPSAKSPVWIRLALILSLVLSLAGLYCSGSRNGYLVASFLLMLGLFCLQTRRWLRGLGLAGLGAFVSSAILFGIGGRHLSLAWVTDDPRVEVWQLAIRLTREYPLLGAGLGNYKLLYDGSVPDHDFVAHAHNIWLMLAAEAGIPAMVGFTIAIALICYQGMQGHRYLADSPQAQAILLGYGLCFLGSILFSVLDVTLFDARINVLGWFCLAVLAAAPAIARRSATTK